MKNSFIIAVLAVFMVSAGLFSFKPHDKKLAEVKQYDGIFIYYLSEPVGDFEQLGKVSNSGIIMNNKPETVLPFMLKRLKRDFPKANAIIFEANMIDAHAAIVE